VLQKDRTDNFCYRKRQAKHMIIKFFDFNGKPLC